MANLLIFDICLVLVLSRAESCFLPGPLYVKVPQTIQAGYRVTKVEVADCDIQSMHLSLTDPSFRIKSNGEIVSSTAVPVSTQGRTFSVRAQDSSGRESEMEVHLVRTTELEKKSNGEVVLKRIKRRWSPPPFSIPENDVGPFPKNIEEIVSDAEAKYKVYYTFTGPGFNEHPLDVFRLDRDTGMLSVHKPVDREEFPEFELITRVFDKSTNEERDDPLPVKIIVTDVNDNAPTFTGSMQCSVQEHSSIGTVVGQLSATDRDQKGTPHVKIRYELMSETGMFAIKPETGVITTLNNNLDREKKDKYMVLVRIKDMDGGANFLSNTGTATITLSDINDNVPTFTKPSYAVQVQENEIGKIVLRIPVEDKDLINTPNWISKFVITEGNQNGNFRIDTDPKTNDGLLYVLKGLDYEKKQNVKLRVMVRNEADLSGTLAQWNFIPVEVIVNDVDEGPEFTAPVVYFNVKENEANGTLIGTYTAVDPETKSSNGISYYKVTDPASWITVDKNTGELRVANTIDRESKFVQNGMYNITMKAVDASSKTGTGTVIIVVEDVNDNVPKIPTNEMVICEKEGELGSVVIVAEDDDQSPLSSPFTFSLPDNHDGKWSLTKLNETAATLRQVKALHMGIHRVPIDVTDLQGFGKTQTANVRICQCRNGVCLAKQSSVSLGPLALLTMLLPLALLLLLFLLLAFFCARNNDNYQIEDIADSGGILIKSNTEAPGEEVDSSFIPSSKSEIGQVIKTSENPGWSGYKSSFQGTLDNNKMYMSGIHASDLQESFSGHYESQYGTQHLNGDYFSGGGVEMDNRYQTQNSGLLHTWQTNGRYLQQKLAYMGTEEDGRYADDIIHGYKFEGVGSTAGSVGCCSDYGDNNDLDFLNTLGPKFKTLADVCTKT